MPKNLDYTILFDAYSPLLTDKQRDTLDLYYNEDLSLGEISEALGITRQGVMNCVKKSEQRLLELEEELGVIDRFRRLTDSVGRLEALLSEERLTNADGITACIEEIKTLL